PRSPIARGKRRRLGTTPAGAAMPERQPPESPRRKRRAGNPPMRRPPPNHERPGSETKRDDEPHLCVRLRHRLPRLELALELISARREPLERVRRELVPPSDDRLMRRTISDPIVPRRALPPHRPAAEPAAPALPAHRSSSNR